MASRQPVKHDNDRAAVFRHASKEGMEASTWLPSMPPIFTGMFAKTAISARLGFAEAP